METIIYITSSVWNKMFYLWLSCLTMFFLYISFIAPFVFRYIQITILNLYWKTIIMLFWRVKYHCIFYQHCLCGVDWFWLAGVVWCQSFSAGVVWCQSFSVGVVWCQSFSAGVVWCWLIMISRGCEVCCPEAIWCCWNTIYSKSSLCKYEFGNDFYKYLINLQYKWKMEQLINYA